MLYNGVVTCQTQSGKTAEVQLDTHNFLEKHQEYPQAEVSFDEFELYSLETVVTQHIKNI